MMATIVRRRDAIAGVLLAGLGVFIVVEARKWELTGVDGPGPGFFPFGYGIAILVLSLMLTVSAAMRGAVPETDSGRSNGGLALALGTWAAFVAAIALMPWLGFTLSFGLLTFVLVAIVFRKPAIKAAITAIACAGSFYVVFPIALGVELPAGRLGF